MCFIYLRPENISSYNHVNSYLVDGEKFFKFSFNVIYYYYLSIFGIAFLMCFIFIGI